MSASRAATKTPEAPGNGYALILDDVSFKRGSRTFGPLSIRVRSGQIVGLLGPNGAGKTSLLRVIRGELKTLAGTIRAHQGNITDLSQSRRQSAGVFVCLHDRRRLRANRSMLEVIASALNCEPKVLVLDEPFNGLQGALPRRVMIALLRTFRDAGTAILFADHDVRAALQVVDRAYLVHRGKILTEGSTNDLLGQPDA